MAKKKESLEEYNRRIMVAQIRNAGTKIRKEELKRQRLNAEANIEYAITLQKRIHEDWKLVIEPLQKTAKKISKDIRGEKELGDIAFDGIIELISREVPSIVMRPPDTILRDIEEVNEFIEDVINKIIKVLSKEGIYFTKLCPVNTDMFLPFAIDEAKKLIDKSVGILRGIIDASK